MTEAPLKHTNRFMEATLHLRDAPGVASRYAVYLSLPERAEREIALTDPHLINCRSRVRDLCLMAGVFHRIPNVAGDDVGRAMGQVVAQPGSGASDETARTRLLTFMRQPWLAAAVTLRSILSQLDTSERSLDWHQLAWAAHHWDNAADHTRDCARWARSFTAAINHDLTDEE